MAMDPIRAADIRQHNTMAILSAIYAGRRNGISQTDVVNRVGLKAPSVFRIFSFLEQEGFIRACEKQGRFDAAKKGRHPMFYTVVPDALYTIGVEFWASYVSIGVFNFNGIRVLSEYEILKEEVNADFVFDSICKKINSAVSKLKLERERIAGIGVAAPGKVRVTDGTIVYYPRIRNMVDFPIGKKLRDVFNLDVVVHNNCSCVASSIYRSSPSADSEKSVFTYLIRGGVNGSFITKDRIYTAADNTTLEVGHVSVDPNGPECSCGLKGCLEVFIKCLDAEYRGDGKESLVLFESIDDYSLPKAEVCLRKAANYFYHSMKSIQRWLSPDEFAFVCPNSFLAEELVKYICEIYENSYDFFQEKKPRIYATAYNNSLAQIGASNLVLDKYFGIS